MEIILQYVAMGFLVVGVTANVVAMAAIIWMMFDMFKGKKQ